MLIVDAGTLFEVAAGTRRGTLIEQRMAGDTEWAAPHVLDVEVLGMFDAACCFNDWT